MRKVIEIKTPNCSRCKMFEPEYKKIQENHPEYEYEVLVFGESEQASEYVRKYSIRSAPTFIVINGEEEKVVKQEELAESL